LRWAPFQPINEAARGIKSQGGIITLPVSSCPPIRGRERGGSDPNPYGRALLRNSKSRFPRELRPPAGARAGKGGESFSSGSSPHRGGGVSAKLRDTVWLISRTHLCGGSIPPGRPSPRVIQQEFKHGGFRSLQRGSAQYALSPSSLSEGSYRPDLVS